MFMLPTEDPLTRMFRIEYTSEYTRLMQNGVPVTRELVERILNKRLEIKEEYVPPFTRLKRALGRFFKKAERAREKRVIKMILHDYDVPHDIREQMTKRLEELSEDS